MTPSEIARLREKFVKMLTVDSETDKLVFTPAYYAIYRRVMEAFDKAVEAMKEE